MWLHTCLLLAGLTMQEGEWWIGYLSFSKVVTCLLYNTTFRATVGRYNLFITGWLSAGALGPDISFLPQCFFFVFFFTVNIDLTVCILWTLMIQTMYSFSNIKLWSICKVMILLLVWPPDLASAILTVIVKMNYK